MLVCLQEAQITECELLGSVQRQRMLVWPAEGCVVAECFCGSARRWQLTGSGARLGFLPCPPQGDRETGKVTVQGQKPMMPQEIRTKGKVTAIIINKD